MITVPEFTLLTISENETYETSPAVVLQSFKGNIKRDWFVNHAYWCLPLTIGNQYGFGIKSLRSFTVEWNGGDTQRDVVVSFLDEEDEPQGKQHISSHFGMGTFTVQNRFTFRTPPGVNLMTINPPNYWIDGIQHMTGVIETDNLRRDFTFNLRVTRKNHLVQINKGDFIGCVIPIPRHFVDRFELKTEKEILTPEEIAEERQAMRDFGVERSGADRHKPHGNGRRYFNGEDVYGNKFPDHQKRIR